MKKNVQKLGVLGILALGIVVSTFTNSSASCENKTGNNNGRCRGDSNGNDFCVDSYWFESDNCVKGVVVEEVNEG